MLITGFATIELGNLRLMWCKYLGQETPPIVHPTSMNLGYLRYTTN